MVHELKVGGREAGLGEAVGGVVVNDLRGTTAVGAYSPRARPGFPIAAPITWNDAVFVGWHPADAILLTQ